MAIVEYLQSLLASLGLGSDRLPLVIGLVSAAIALVFARPFFSRLGRIIEAIFLRNWQLGLLGTTGIVLSLASGWTTWDGMKNFTGEPILSAMVTFGIQGLMLIVAWLIGESFATGMNQQVPAGKSSNDGYSSDTGVKSALGLTLSGIALSGVAAVMHGFYNGRPDPSRVALWLALIGGASMLAGLLIVASKAHTLRGYFDATRVIIRTAVLWVMFLACMATSVFFSFDSLFSTIFPASERVRAAELRAQNQVAGIVNDIGGTIVRGQLTETEHLFATDGWNAYDAQLSKLAVAAQSSQKLIEDFFQTQMEERRRGIAQQQERVTTAQSGTVGLANKKTSLTDELARLKGDRPALAEDFSKRKGDVDAFLKELDAKRVEAMAEARGVEGTGKIGEGAMFRARKAEEQTLKDKQKIAEERLRDAQKRFQQVETRLTQLESEMSIIDGDIAKMKGEAQTAEQRIKFAEDAKGAEEGPRLDPTRIIPAFEKARSEFRQTPKLEGLSQVQNLCSQLVASLSMPATKEKIAGIDCDPKTAAEAASRVFALNAGVTAFENNCAGGDKLARYRTADELFGFARKCVQDSGLASKDTDDLRQKINFIELNRDDKANRFVVTWNAFQDGNRLAYLSLAIAIAVDGLVFMSGLFGANAVRSPLSDVPTSRARSAEQLESIMDNALLPHRFENAHIAIEAMHADTSLPGYTAIVDLRELDPQSATVVRRILNAGATINAVLRNPDEPTVYAVRPELYEYLALTGARAFEKHGKLVQEDVAEKVRQGELEKMVRVALLPDEMANAETVLHYAHPMNATDDGFMSQIILKQVANDDVRVVRRVLNAGAAHRAVRIAQGEDQPYEIHADLYKTLSKIRARLLLSGGNNALQIGQVRHPVIDGGAMREERPQLGHRGVDTAGQPGHNFAGDEPLDASIAPRAIEAARRNQNGRRAAPEVVRPIDIDPALVAFDAKLDEHFAPEVNNLEAQHIRYLRENADSIPVPELLSQLENVMRFDPAIARPLLQAKAGLEESIERARDSFSAFEGEQPSAPARLDEFARILRQMTPVLVLMPDQAYITIVKAMLTSLDIDSGAGNLTDVQASKRDLLRNHIAELATAYKSDDCWNLVARSLNRYGRGLVTRASNVDQGEQRRG